jgi:CTP synthase (UTP-ammonia lyase)
MPLRWLPTDAVQREGSRCLLTGATAVWCVPGSPYASTRGALQAIEYARTSGLAFLGTCGGFQHALMEYCQNVLGRPAAHEEMDPDAEGALIVKLSCSLSDGAVAPVFATHGGWYAGVVGTDRRDEEFNCNYGLAPAFEALFDGTPLRRALNGELHPLVRAFFQCAA